jgi:hypothetical protein
VLVKFVKILTVPIPQVIAVKVRSRMFQKIKLIVNFTYIILIYDVYNCVWRCRCLVLRIIMRLFLCPVAQNAVSASKLLDASAHLWTLYMPLKINALALNNLWLRPQNTFLNFIQFPWNEPQLFS